MNKIVFDAETMKLMSLFESLTRASLKDCFELGGTLYFVVQPGELGKALGRNASNVKRLIKLVKKRIKIVEFSDKVVELVRNIIQPLKAADIQQDDGVISITPVDNTTRGYLIGRGGESLRNLESIVRRYYDINEIKVVRSA